MDPDLGPTPSRSELATHLARPGAEARLRAAIEGELGVSAGLDPSALLHHALTLLEQGRVVADRVHDELPGVDPTRPAGNVVVELGNLVDLVEGLAGDDPSDDAFGLEPLRPSWIESAVVDA